eukprot:11013359-Alexandrium_andersonii.AAC.1
MPAWMMDTKMRQPPTCERLMPTGRLGATKSVTFWPGWPTESVQGPEGPVNKMKRQEKERPNPTKATGG